MTSILAAPRFCASPGPGQRRCASNLHNVLSWVVYEEYFYSTAPFPEKRGIHHKVSLTLGDGAGLGEGPDPIRYPFLCFSHPETATWKKERRRFPSENAISCHIPSFNTKSYISLQQPRTDFYIGIRQIGELHMRM